MDNAEPSVAADPDGSPAVRVSDLHVSLGGSTILKGIDLDIVDGELLVLLGPSGCGKTTLLNTINGLLTPEQGSVVVHGADVTHVSSNNRDMVFVFQSYALFPHMNVFRNVAFGLRMRKVPKAEIQQRVQEILGVVHLDSYGDRRVGELSGGQQQRVALARALVLRPSLLLMDEPLSNLDAKLRAALRVEIAQIQREVGITTIFVSHDQVEAMTIADRIVLMDDGRLQQVAPPLAMYQAPANAFVAGFIGSPAINMEDVHVRGGTAEFSDWGTSVPADSLAELLWDSPEGAVVPDGEYIFGVRPEDLVLDTSQAPVVASGTLAFTESLGSETLLHIGVDEATLVARTPGLPPAGVTHHRRLPVGVRPRSAHLFTQDADHQRVALSTRDS